MKRARRTPPSFAHNAAVRPRYSLAEMLLQIPEGAPIDEEWETMQPVGREVEPSAVTLHTIRVMQRFIRKLRKKRAGRGISFALKNSKTCSCSIIRQFCLK